MFFQYCFIFLKNTQYIISWHSRAKQVPDSNVSRLRQADCGTNRQCTRRLTSDLRSMRSVAFRKITVEARGSSFFTPASGADQGPPKGTFRRPSERRNPDTPQRWGLQKITDKSRLSCISDQFDFRQLDCGKTFHRTITLKDKYFQRVSWKCRVFFNNTWNQGRDALAEVVSPDSGFAWSRNRYDWNRSTALPASSQL